MSPFSRRVPSCSSLSRCSKHIRSLETFSFFDIIFFRFSTEFSPSTRTEKLPPVVVVTFNVIGVVTVEGPLPELVPHPSAAAGATDDDEADEEDVVAAAVVVGGVDDGPPSRESPPPDFSIVLR